MTKEEGLNGVCRVRCYCLGWHLAGASTGVRVRGREKVILFLVGVLLFRGFFLFLSLVVWSIWLFRPGCLASCRWELGGDDSSTNAPRRREVANGRDVGQYYR